MRAVAEEWWRFLISSAILALGATIVDEPFIQAGMVAMAICGVLLGLGLRYTRIR